MAAETGLVMIVCLDEAWERVRTDLDDKLTISDLRHAGVEGAVKRVPPRMMTVSTAIIGIGSTRKLVDYC